MVRTQSIAGRDEVTDYQDARSIGSSEACWRTFNYDLSEASPPVERLAVHLENQQYTTFAEGSERQRVEKGAPVTTLTHWFDYLRRHHATDPDCLQYKYCDFPEQYKYCKKSGWTRRVRGTTEEKRTIGRVHTVHPKVGEQFYLRTLLHHVPASELAPFGFTYSSFLRVPGRSTPADSFKQACELRGLLQDDEEWHRVLQDAASDTVYMPKMRELFVSILLYCEPQDSATLFETFYMDMADDFKPLSEVIGHRRSVSSTGVAADDQLLRALVLLELEHALHSQGATLADHHLELTAEDRTRALAHEASIGNTVNMPREIRDELPADREALAQDAATRRAQMAELRSQRALVDAVIHAVDTGTQLCAFVDAPGGTGKTVGSWQLERAKHDCENAPSMTG